MEKYAQAPIPEDYTFNKKRIFVSCEQSLDTLGFRALRGVEDIMGDVVVQLRSAPSDSAGSDRKTASTFRDFDGRRVAGSLACQNPTESLEDP